MPSYRKSGINKFITKNLALVIFLVIGLVAALAVSLVSTELRPQASNLTEQLNALRRSTPPIPPTCNNTCTGPQDTSCGTGLGCFSIDSYGHWACRVPTCIDETDCTCNTPAPTPTPPPTTACNNACTGPQDTSCGTGLGCFSIDSYGHWACRVPTCIDETDCTCNTVNTIQATARALCNNRVSLQWTTTYSDAPYKIYRCTGSSCTPQPNQLIGQTNSLTYLDNGPLKAGNTYNYRIDSVHVSSSTFGKVKITLPRTTLVCPVDY